ncbi:MAG: hypothetical protein ACPGWR_33270, partial [Ardenticatenaceae bacterium]
VDQPTIAHICHGRPLPKQRYEKDNAFKGLIRALDQAGRLVAILRWDEKKGWQPKKVFVKQ